MTRESALAKNITFELRVLKNRLDMELDKIIGKQPFEMCYSDEEGYINSKKSTKPNYADEIKQELHRVWVGEADFPANCIKTISKELEKNPHTQQFIWRSVEQISPDEDKLWSAALGTDWKEKITFLNIKELDKRTRINDGTRMTRAEINLMRENAKKIEAIEAGAPDDKDELAGLKTQNKLFLQRFSQLNVRLLFNIMKSELEHRNYAFASNIAKELIAYLGGSENNKLGYTIVSDAGGSFLGDQIKYLHKELPDFSDNDSKKLLVPSERAFSSTGVSTVCFATKVNHTLLYNDFNRLELPSIVQKYVQLNYDNVDYTGIDLNELTKQLWLYTN